MEYYLYIKAFHVISFVAWLAVLFYLPRLFVYQICNKDKRDFVDVVKIQQYRLYFLIGTPAIVLTLLTGSSLIILNPAIFKSGMWIHIKFLFVIFLIAYHVDCGRRMYQLRKEIYKRSDRFYRIYNEIPTLLLFIIVFCAVLKF